jgi:glycerophosphoryl diester phosphodiesterase
MIDRYSDPVPTRLPSIRRPPIAFAHRGARAHAPENTIEAFELGLRLGATGLESDVWLTADGIAVLDHDGLVGRRPRRTAIGRLQRSAMPRHMPTLSDLYAACGTSYEFSLDLKDPAAMAAVAEAAEQADQAAFDRLWICHHDLGVLSEWRSRWPTLHLVHSTFLGHMDGGPERHAATLTDIGIDAVNLHHTEWTGGFIALYHRFDRLAFAWDVQFDRVMSELLDCGIDALYSDHVDVLMAAVDRVSG